MRRSTRLSLLSAGASLPAVDVHRLSHRLMWLVLALALGLSALSGTVGSATASQPTAGQSDLLLEEGESYEMQVWAANCQIVPAFAPGLNDAGCVPAVGAYVEFVADDGTLLGACNTNEVLPDGTASRCSIFIPLSIRGEAYLDTGTIDGAFAPRMNPIPFGSPGPGRIDGIVGFPIFVNLLTGNAGQTDQTQPVEQPQQQAAPADRYAFIITGSCAEPGETLDGRIDVYIPQGDPLGLPTAIVAESGGGPIAVALDDLFASPHAVIVVTPSDGQGTDVACGDLGTVADDDGIAVIGLHPAQGSEIGGIAYLATDPSTGQVLLSIFLAAGLG